VQYRRAGADLKLRHIWRQAPAAPAAYSDQTVSLISTVQRPRKDCFNVTVSEQAYSPKTSKSRAKSTVDRSQAGRRGCQQTKSPRDLRYLLSRSSSECGDQAISSTRVQALARSHHVISASNSSAVVGPRSIVVMMDYKDNRETEAKQTDQWRGRVTRSISTSVAEMF